jgi:hypothetical protein
MKQIEVSLAQIDKFRRTKDTDWPALLVGPPGTGKSTLGIQLCQRMDPNFDVKTQVVNTPSEMARAMRMLPQYASILYDEGMKSMMSRRAMTTENIEQISALAQVRHRKNYFILIVVQDLQLSEKHLRTSRANCIFRCVYGRDQLGLPQQGLVLVYGKKAMKRIKVGSEGVIWPRCNYADCFDSLEGTAIWEEYLKQVGKQKQTSLEESSKRIDAKRKGKKIMSNKQAVQYASYQMEVMALAKKKIGGRAIADKLKRRYQFSSHQRVRTILENHYKR